MTSLSGDSQRAWWRHAVFYQIYPLSFVDSNGDGFGDLAGITSRLDYLSETLGVDALWLSPFYKSPMRDWGYDISGHTEVDPLFGALETAELLIDEAHLSMAPRIHEALEYLAPRATLHGYTAPGRTP